MFFPHHINPIIKLTEECNYQCVFCRYANHRKKDNGISIQAVCSIIQQCTEYNQSKGVQNMNIIFHGGEPLLYGIDRFQEIIDFEKLINKSGFVISNTVQTNSSLINDKWIDLFSENAFNVGISFDGPIPLNGHFAKSQLDAQNRVISSYHSLKQRNVSCGILSVVTEKHLSYPEEFFDFLINNDITSVGICYCYNQIDDISIDPVSLGYYLIELYKLYFNSHKQIKIREFDLATRLFLKRSVHECTMSCRSSCGSFLTFTPDGSVEFCDDYDLNKNVTLGNINDHTLFELIGTDRYQKMKTQALKMVDNKCKDCSVYGMCQSGCMRSDTGDSNYFCETYKILYPFIMKTVTEYLNEKAQ